MTFASLVSSGRVCHALFSPQDDVCGYLQQLIKMEQNSIDIAMYHFTSGPIAEMLLNAHARKVSITIVVDRSCIADRYNKVELLAAKGIKVLVYDPFIEWGKETNGLMHNKFMILGKNIVNRPILVSGSFNYTSSAATKNYENVFMCNDQLLVKQYQEFFEQLKKKSKPLKWWRENRPLLYYTRDKERLDILHKKNNAKMAQKKIG